ncbi:sigma factor [Massilia scottii]|uniref:sigma factor n=1 Tax=Massilia scottii TaxID=3057166 RepID=UPI0027B8BE0D|nr:sigma factor [Massilia sp. CCM 9210]
MQRGSERSFFQPPAIVFERYHLELLNFLHRLLGDRRAAADLAQESFVRVPRRGRLLQAGCAMLALLVTGGAWLGWDHERRPDLRRAAQRQGIAGNRFLSRG